MYWVLGVDPGLTTGVALISVTPSSCQIELMGQRPPEEVCATLHKAAEFRTGQLGLMYLAYEMYTGAGPRTTESRITTELVGFLKHSALDFGFVPVPQTNQSRIAFLHTGRQLADEQFPDNKFRVHEIDALAHTLRCRDSIEKGVKFK
jgi:hypothetical protein